MSYFLFVQVLSTEGL